MEFPNLNKLQDRIESLENELKELKSKPSLLGLPSLDDEMENYKNQHKKGLTRLTHLFGIPIVALSVVNIMNPPVALSFFLIGWGLQILGHKVFEGNDPVIFQDPKNSPKTMLVSLIFAFNEWKEVFKGKWSLKDHD